ncbi:conserved protein of unknown function [Limnospira indica PCC 8005]|uniref:Uncharacterized protein n=1 Tax=Limnospira indica PCC 8005 TaxID=376219 RepID=A0A9P1KFT0_9CYAN|nr:conserved protein of unknown function [Limnospira indica PCC 8005]
MISTALSRLYSSLDFTGHGCPLLPFEEWDPNQLTLGVKPSRDNPLSSQNWAIIFYLYQCIKIY